MERSSRRYRSRIYAPGRLCRRRFIVSAGEKERRCCRFAPTSRRSLESNARPPDLDAVAHSSELRGRSQCLSPVPLKELVPDARQPYPASGRHGPPVVPAVAGPHVESGGARIGRSLVHMPVWQCDLAVTRHRRRALNTISVTTQCFPAAARGNPTDYAMPLSPRSLWLSVWCKRGHLRRPRIRLWSITSHRR
jgi:hypothetical protein